MDRINNLTSIRQISNRNSIENKKAPVQNLYKGNEEKISNELDKLALINKVSFSGNPITETQKSADKNLVVGKNGSFDFRNKDISGIKFDKRVILDACLDNTTKMSHKQTDDIKNHISEMKKPGLCSENLKSFIEGDKQINLAIIDDKLSNHVSYNQAIKSYCERGFDETDKPTDHASGTVSIIADKDNGIVPKANIHYYAAKNEKDSNKNYTSVIKEIIEENKNKDNKDKISMIVITQKNNENASDYKEFEKTVKEAIDSGIFVVTRNMSKFYDGYDFGGLDRDPLQNSDDPRNYNVVDKYREKNIYVPMNHMVTAKCSSDKSFDMNKTNSDLDAEDKKTYTRFGQLSNWYLCDKNDEIQSYRYEGKEGGRAWGAAWLAGVYAACKTKYNDMTPLDFFKVADLTSLNHFELNDPDIFDADKDELMPADHNGNHKFFAKLINPVALFNGLETYGLKPCDKK